MINLYFLVNWENDKQKAWSGTSFGLYHALSNHFDVQDINLYQSRNSLIAKILQKLKLKSSDFGYHGIIRSRDFVENKILRSDDYAIFQFEEIIVDKSHPTYIYQDLSISYIKFLSETDATILNYSGFNVPNIANAIKKRYESQMKYYETCQGVFTMGKWLRKDLIERCGLPESKVHHVGGGINLDPKRINPQKKTNNKMLFVGRDFKRKGGYLVYNAFQKLKVEKKDAELYVAGPKNDPIKNPIEGYFYMGDCTHEQLSQLFNTCDIFCMPSYFEAYGLVFIEALTYGLPCIGRNAYEMPYFIENNKTGYLLNTDSPNELAGLMLDLLSNEKIKQNVENKRQWYLNEYSWESVAERIFLTILKK